MRPRPWEDHGSRGFSPPPENRNTARMDDLRERMVRESARLIEDNEDNIDRAHRMDIGKHLTTLVYYLRTDDPTGPVTPRR